MQRVEQRPQVAGTLVELERELSRTQTRIQLADRIVRLTSPVLNGWVVELSCMASYPRFAATDDIVELADSVLAEDDLDLFVRRALSDGTDDLRRLRASRRTFGGS